MFLIFPSIRKGRMFNQIDLDLRKTYNKMIKIIHQILIKYRMSEHCFYIVRFMKTVNKILVMCLHLYCLSMSMRFLFVLR